MNLQLSVQDHIASYEADQLEEALEELYDTASLAERVEDMENELRTREADSFMRSFLSGRSR